MPFPTIEAGKHDTLVQAAIDEIRAVLMDRFPDCLDGSEVIQLPYSEAIADNPVKCVFRSRAGQPLAIAMLSRPAFPSLVERSVLNIRAARACLPASLAAPILEPLVAGTVDSLSYTVFPYCRPTSNSRIGWRLQRVFLGRRVFRWLAQVYRASRRTVFTDEEAASSILRPLEFILGCDVLSPATRDAAAMALRRYHAGQWRPSLHVSHNDFWKGNVLLTNPVNPLLDSGRSRFFVIDWAGSSTRGQPIYDLLRAAMSFRLPRRKLAKTLAIFCRFMNCESIDCMGSLLAGLGWIGLHREHFPLGRFAQVAEDCRLRLHNVLFAKKP